MSYLIRQKKRPLDEESKIRGKAAVDGAGSRLGKSIGGMVITVLTTLSGIIGCGNDISDVKNIVIAVIFLVIIVWLYAVHLFTAEVTIHHYFNMAIIVVGTCGILYPTFTNLYPKVFRLFPYIWPLLIFFVFCSRWVSLTYE